MTVASMTSAPAISVGVVSYLNTLPLIDGLDGLVDLSLRPSVPSLLVELLERQEVEIALCSSIDYQQSSVPLVVAPAGVLGCRGATMTVRLYASGPIEELESVHVDTDSHTSVVLLQVLLKEKFGIAPRMIPYGAREHVADSRPLEWPGAMLLIGDKVVTDSPPAVRYPHQMDLGAAWFESTGLPFVFATWMARADADIDRVRLVARILDRQRRHNLERIDGIITRRAIPRGWPADLARVYLTQRLMFEFTDDARRGLELFYAKAHEQGLVRNHRPVQAIDF